MRAGQKDGLKKKNKFDVPTRKNKDKKVMKRLKKSNIYMLYLSLKRKEKKN